MANDVVIGSDGKPVEYVPGQGIAFSKIHGSHVGTIVDRGRSRIAGLALMAGEAASMLSGTAATVGLGAAAMAASAPTAQAQEMTEAQRMRMEKEERRQEGIKEASALYLRKWDENKGIQQRYDKYREMWGQTVNDDIFYTGEQAERQNPKTNKAGKKSTLGTILLGTAGEVLDNQAMKEAARRREDEARQQGQIANQTTMNDAANQAQQQQQIAQGVIEGVRQTAGDLIESDKRFTEDRTNIMRDKGLSATDLVEAKKQAEAAYKELNDGEGPVEKVQNFDPTQIKRERRTPLEKKEDPNKRKKEGASLHLPGAAGEKLEVAANDLSTTINQGLKEMGIGARVPSQAEMNSQIAKLMAQKGGKGGGGMGGIGA